MISPELRSLELCSTLTPSGMMRLALEEVAVNMPGSGELLVRVEATPVNPSDLLLLVGPIETASIEVELEGGRPVLTAPVPPTFMPALQARVGKTLKGGLEGAGTVIAAGDDARSLVGRKVAMWNGGMFAQYRKVSVRDCALLPEDVSVAEAASNYTNPMTALSMIETIRQNGHQAFVQTAAASNLGQMLNRISQADSLQVVNIVRDSSQVDLLRCLGAKHVLDSTSREFFSDLVEAISATGAHVAFDPIGGGRLASEILQAMEAAIRRSSDVHPLYGSTVHKHVYICGALDRSPIELDRRPFGQAWSIGGFYVETALAELGEEKTDAMRARVIRELKTTFCSHYAAKISLEQLLDPEIFNQAMRKSTGGKYLLDPSL